MTAPEPGSTWNGAPGTGIRRPAPALGVGRPEGAAPGAVVAGTRAAGTRVGLRPVDADAERRTVRFGKVRA